MSIRILLWRNTEIIITCLVVRFEHWCSVIYIYINIHILYYIYIDRARCKLDWHQNTKPGCVDHSQWSWHLKIPSEFFHEHISKFPNEVTEHGMRCAIVLQCRFFSCAVSTASCPQSQFLALSLYPQFFLKWPGRAISQRWRNLRWDPRLSVRPKVFPLLRRKSSSNHVLYRAGLQERNDLNTWHNRWTFGRTFHSSLCCCKAVTAMDM
jgi:hypothetical protein